MYKIKKNGIPFLIKELRVSRSIFQNAPKKVTILPATLEGVNGSAAKYTIQDAIKAAFGEHIERTSLYINAGNFKSESVNAFNLVTLESEEISLKKVLLCFHSKLLREHVEKDKDYSDSSGVASHVHSYPTINSAFLEFFERQCLVHNWLTQSSGKMINEETITSDRILKYIISAKNYIDNLYFFDISLHPNIHVILTIGLGQKHMALGLSAHWELEEAMYRSIEEMFQFFGNAIHKRYLAEGDYIFKAQNYEGDITNDPHFYSNYFFQTFTPEKLKDSYKYLFEKSPKTEFQNNKNENPRDFVKDVQKVGRDLELDIKLVVIPTVNKNLPTKIVKILSTNGYPHMLTQIINPYDCVLSKSLGHDYYPNIHTLIPFP